MQPIKDALARLEQVYAAYSEPDADFDKLATEQGQLEALLATVDGHNLDRQLDIAADALRLPPWEASVAQPVGRREAPRRPVPAAAVQTRHAAARRADQPSRRRVGGLAGEVPGAVPGHGDLRHPRPVLPRQRRRLDPRTRPRPRHPLGGQLLLLAGAEGTPPGAGGEAAGGAAPHAGARARVGARQPEGPPGQEQGAPAPVRGAVVGRIPGAQRDQRDLHPARAPPRRPGDRGRGPAQRLRRPAADRRTCPSACRAAASSASSARTAPARPRCFAC